MKNANRVLSAEKRTFLQQWHTYINLQDTQKIESARKELSELMKTEDEPTIKYYYDLLRFRYSIYKKDFREAEQIIKEIEYPAPPASKKHLFYLHFFKGIYHHSSKDGKKALEQFNLAKKYLEDIDQQLDIAEFHYKLGSVHYDQQQTVLSVNYLNQAIETYKEKSINLEERIIGCELLLGLNYVDIKQFDLAEVHFHNALGLVKKLGNLDLEIMVLHNLGLFYAEQQLSEAAIRYLKKVLEHKSYEYHLRAVFLITKEYLKAQEYANAQEWFDHGLSLSSKNNDQSYLYKFNLLYELYLSDSNNDHSLFEEGISYFKSEEMYAVVEDYSVQIAEYFRKREDYKQSTKYYAEAYKAKEQINKMEALK